MPDTPSFTTVGDEALEARIVAWVLGDASAFEAAELERLCGERPELLIFRRRMRALHGLLSEAETAQPDPGWKLPPSKSKALDDLFGSPPAPMPAIGAARRTRHRFNWPLAALAASVIFVLFVAGFGAGGSAMKKAKSLTLKGGSDLAMEPSVSASRSDRVALEPGYPPELIEGTPTEIHLPGVIGADRGMNAPSPSAPSSSTSRVIAANTIAPTQIPIPDTAGDSPSADFGGGDDFGGGWGGKRDQKPASAPTRPSGELANRLSLSDNDEDGLLAGGDDIESNDRRGGDRGIEDRKTRDTLAKRESAKSDGTNAKALEQAADSSRGELLAGETAAQLDAASTAAAAVPATPPPALAVAGKVTIHPTEYEPPASDADPFTSEVPTRSGIPTLGRLFSGSSPANEPPPSLSDGRLAKTGEWKKEKSESQITAGSKVTVLGGRGSLGEREMIRRQDSVSEADRLLQEGRDAYQKGDFEKAKEDFKTAAKELPDAPALEDRRKAIAEHEALADTALDIQDAREIDTVRRSLYTAEGAYNLGKWDQAKAEYENVLRMDPYNSAARRGMEQISSAKSAYYRAAYDHTRSEMLMEVDKAWETALPADKSAMDRDGGERYVKRLPENLDTSDRDALAEAMRLKRTELEMKGIKVQRKTPPAPPAKPAPADFGSEVSASEDAYSTFSLNVSDASFKTARAALARGEQPDPTSIRVEQFYNAMDYGDPSPASGEAVAAKIEQAAHPLIPGRNLVRIALRTAAAGRSASQPLRLTLLIDQSGSMIRDDRRQAMALALRELASLLTPQDRVTVVGFSLQARLLADSVSGAQLAALPALAQPEANEGGTNLEQAILLGGQIANARKQAGAQNRIVLLTDGAANLGDADPDRLAESIKQLRQQGLAFDVAGLGTSELNDRLLAELARHGDGRYYVVDAAADEPNGFAKQLAGAFRPAAENVKVQVRFNPNRVGGYRLVGFEEHRLKKEDFHNDAVDAAELAAAEAGVALYQVEPLPGGSGDLGKVSVRFREVASGRMVERSWSIPYEPAAPAFDRAAPSLQLAGLAMLSAEKLRGGALADAIDFAHFAPSRSAVRQTYPNNRRVAELLEMIDKLR